MPSGEKANVATAAPSAPRPRPWGYRHCQQPASIFLAVSWPAPGYLVSRVAASHSQWHCWLEEFHVIVIESLSQTFPGFRLTGRRRLGRVVQHFRVDESASDGDARVFIVGFISSKARRHGLRIAYCRPASALGFQSSCLDPDNRLPRKAHHLLRSSVISTAAAAVFFPKLFMLCCALPDHARL